MQVANNLTGGGGDQKGATGGGSFLEAPPAANITGGLKKS